MSCPRCHKPITSGWVAQREPLVLRCPDCDVEVKDPFPGLPLVEASPRTRQGRRAAALAVVFLLMLACAALWTRRKPRTPLPSSFVPVPQAPVQEATAPPAQQADQKQKPPDAEEPQTKPAHTETVAPEPAIPSDRDAPAPAPPPGRPAARAPTGAAEPGAGSATATAIPGAGAAPLTLPPVVFSRLSPVRCMALSPAEPVLATGHEDGKVRVWRLLDSVGPAATLTCAEAPPVGLDFWPDGTVLGVLTGRQIHLYRLRDGSRITRFECSGEVVGFAISPRGEHFASADRSGRVLVRSLSMLTVVGRTRVQGPATCLTWAQGGRFLVVGSADNAVRVWEADSMSLQRVLLGHMDWVCSAAGDALTDALATASWDHTIRIWSLHKGSVRSVLFGHGGKVTALAMAPGGRLTASGDELGVVKVWDGSTADELDTIRGHTGAIAGLGFVAPGWLVTASRDGSARTWPTPSPSPAPAADQRSDADEPRKQAYSLLIAKGRRLARRQQHDQAVAAFREASQLRPQYAEAHFCLAEGLRSAGRAEEAVAAYRQAVQLSPDFGWAWYRLGSMLLAMGHDQVGLAALQQACRMLPDHGEAHLSLGRALLAWKRYGEAKAAFETAADVLPLSPQAHHGLGQACAGLRQWDTAIAEMRRAIDLDRNFAAAYSDLIDAILSKNPEAKGEARGWAELAHGLGIAIRDDTERRLGESPVPRD